jgi:hypothetical protein
MIDPAKVTRSALQNAALIAALFLATEAVIADKPERDPVVVIAPMPAGYGAIPGASDDVAAMSAHAEVIFVSPDKCSVDAIGPNPYDPDRARRPPTPGVHRADP